MMIFNHFLNHCILLIALLCIVPTSQARDSLSLMQVWETISTKKFVDLTHTFYPGIPHWKGYDDEEITVQYWYNKNDGIIPKKGYGYNVQSYSFVGQWGTHIDAPAHFIQGKRTLDQISVKEMIMPLVVIDIHNKVKNNPDYTVTLDDINNWENKHGLIPSGSFVALRSDWSNRWPDVDKMNNKDARGISHYPGWSIDALKYLYESRHITASGHETTDTDPGFDTSRERYPLETYILNSNHYQVELLTHLDLVPEWGALIVVSFAKPKEGSGFPVRAFAILPQQENSR